ncbi:MAG: DUF433 domain-containing protein, partial [Cyanobacteria bacterium J06639_1]
MTSMSYQQAAIVRTERGLAIAGTRITLYDVMDYLLEQYPPKFIRSWLRLTEEQMSVALSYIEDNRSTVESEYRSVLNEVERTRQYWEQ